MRCLSDFKPQKRLMTAIIYFIVWTLGFNDRFYVFIIFLLQSVIYNNDNSKWAFYNWAYLISEALRLVKNYNPKRICEFIKNLPLRNQETNFSKNKRRPLEAHPIGSDTKFQDY